MGDDPKEGFHSSNGRPPGEEPSIQEIDKSPLEEVLQKERAKSVVYEFKMNFHYFEGKNNNNNKNKHSHNNVYKAHKGIIDEIYGLTNSRCTLYHTGETVFNCIKNSASFPKDV